MKIKPGFVLRDIAGANVVVPVGENLVNFNNMIILSETGAFIWKALSNSDLDKERLLDLMLEEYEVSADVASVDIDKFIDSLLQANVLQVG